MASLFVCQNHKWDEPTERPSKWGCLLFPAAQQSDLMGAEESLDRRDESKAESRTLFRTTLSETEMKKKKKKRCSDCRGSNWTGRRGRRRGRRDEGLTVWQNNEQAAGFSTWSQFVWRHEASSSSSSPSSCVIPPSLSLLLSSISPD